jgi:hypothetical protein
MNLSVADIVASETRPLHATVNRDAGGVGFRSQMSRTRSLPAWTRTNTSIQPTVARSLHCEPYRGLIPL